MDGWVDAPEFIAPRLPSLVRLPACLHLWPATFGIRLLISCLPACLSAYHFAAPTNEWLGALSGWQGGGGTFCVCLSVCPLHAYESITDREALSACCTALYPTQFTSLIHPAIHPHHIRTDEFLISVLM